MAVTFDAVSQGTIGGASSQTISHTVGSGSNRVLYVFSACLNSTDYLASGSATYNGTSLGSPIGSASVAGNSFMYVWRMTAPPSGTANVVVTPSASAFLHTFCISVADADQSTPEGTITNTAVPSSTPSPITTAVTTASGGMAIGMVSRKVTGVTFTPEGADTQAGTTQSAGVSTSAASYEADSTGLGWAFTGSGALIHLVVPVNPAAGGSTAISFTGTIATQTFTAGDSVDVDLSTYFSGTETPFSYSSVGTSFAALGLSINSSTGHLTGTAVEGSVSGCQIRGTDATPDTADSNTFTITVNAAAENPVITSQPSNATVKRGQTATFTVAATGSGTVTYQWQRNPGGVGSWADISGATSASYTTPATTVSGGTANDQDDYRCQVSDDDAGPVASDVVTLTVQQCVLAINAAGYEFGNGNSPATMAVDNAVAWEVEVIDDALPPSSVYHADSLTTSSVGRLADIGDDDFVFGTTYTVLARRVSDGEWIVFTIDAS